MAGAGAHDDKGAGIVGGEHEHAERLAEVGAGDDGAGGGVGRGSGGVAGGAFVEGEFAEVARDRGLGGFDAALAELVEDLLLAFDAVFGDDVEDELFAAGLFVHGCSMRGCGAGVRRGGAARGCGARAFGRA